MMLLTNHDILLRIAMNSDKIMVRKEWDGQEIKLNRKH